MGAGFAYRNLGIKQTIYWILATSKGWLNKQRSHAYTKLQPNLYSHELYKRLSKIRFITCWTLGSTWHHGEFPLHQSVLICVRSNRSPFFYFPYLYTCIICMSCVCQLLNKWIYDDDDDHKMRAFSGPPCTFWSDSTFDLTTYSPLLASLPRRTGSGSVERAMLRRLQVRCLSSTTSQH